MFPLAFFGARSWRPIGLFWIAGVICIIKAFQGKRFKMPMIGAFAAEAGGRVEQDTRA